MPNKREPAIHAALRLLVVRIRLHPGSFRRVGAFHIFYRIGRLDETHLLLRCRLWDMLGRSVNFLRYDLEPELLVEEALPKFEMCRVIPLVSRG